jgi:uncharacterized membrane protein
VVLAELHDWLMLVHILGAMVWVGGAAVLTALALWSLRQPDDAAVGRFVASLRTIGPAVLAPGPMLLLASALWLVFDEDSSMFGDMWIQLGLGLFAAAFLVGVVHNSRAAIAAERATQGGDIPEATRQLRLWVAGSAVILTCLLVATWDMVFMPGL